MEKSSYRKKDLRVESSEEGRKAVTHYKVIRRSKFFTFLELELETGRKHQIRVHCKEAGFPVIGDKKYGLQCNPIGRLGLHALCLEFIHPFLNKKISIKAPIPQSFKKLGVF